ncbi:MAG: hypothetical protein ACKV2U_25435 [Bryobacteraceae bacterium]
MKNLRDLDVLSGTTSDSGLTRRIAVPENVEVGSMGSRRLDGGLDLCTLPAGTVVESRTRNSVYTIRLEEGGGILIAGHPEHCPGLTAVQTLGSVLVTGEISDRRLAPGFRMEFRVGPRRVFTSRVVEVAVKERA